MGNHEENKGGEMKRIKNWFTALKLRHINKHLLWLQTYMRSVPRDVRKRIKKDMFTADMSTFWLENK